MKTERDCGPWSPAAPHEARTREYGGGCATATVFKRANWWEWRVVDECGTARLGQPRRAAGRSINAVAAMKQATAALGCPRRFSTVDPRWEKVSARSRLEDALSIDPRHVKDLAWRSGLAVQHVHSELSRGTQTGWAQRVKPGWFVKPGSFVVSATKLRAPNKQNRIHDYLCRQGAAKAPEVAEALGIGTTAARSTLNTLLGQGRALRATGGRWRAKDC